MTSLILIEHAGYEAANSMKLWRQSETTMDLLQMYHRAANKASALLCSDILFAQASSPFSRRVPELHRLVIVIYPL